MELRHLVAAMESIAPTRFAESWDNVGLLVGDPGAALERVLLAIDYTPEVAAEARARECDAVVAYHPVIFEGVKRIHAGSPAFDAVRDGIGIYCPHTALDAAAGGTNDVLADLLGLRERTPLRFASVKDGEYLIRTCAGPDELGAVSAALVGAGASRVETWEPADHGRRHAEGWGPGAAEGERKVRVEAKVTIARSEAVVAALRDCAPLRERAIDLIRLAASPGGVGMGRFGVMDATPRAALLARIKQGLGVDHVLVAGPTEGDVQRAAVLAGACGDFVNDALARRADLLLTGEMRHHDALKAARAGMTVVCALHSRSERVTLARLAPRLEAALPGVEVRLAERDRDPFEVR